jgi:hypothetical protein
MNLSPFADAPFDDENAFTDFLGAHEVAHQTIANRVTALGRIVTTLPISDAEEDMTDWLLDHYDIHRQIAAALGTHVPDISSVDLDDENQYLDWMRTHASMHESINAALGIR